MRTLILTFTLPLMVFLFSLTPIAKACTACELGRCPFICGAAPEGVLRTYKCELGCPCPEGATDPECAACDRLEMAFNGIECWTSLIDCDQPPLCSPPGVF